MAEEFKNPATEVANENPNVVTEATSINNFNSNDMVEKKPIATEAAPIAEDAANEVSNAAENAVSTNQNPDNKDNKEKVVPTTKLAKINGEYVEITIAYTKYSMELPEYNEKFCKNLEHSKLLPVIYNFAKPEVFWKEGIQLYDRAGDPIEEGRPNVYVECSSAESWRVWIDKKLERVELHEFCSVQDYAQAVGTSNLYSRGLNNTEKIGIAALATGNEAYKAVFEFAKKHGLTSTAANLYLNVKMTKLQMMKMSTGLEPKAKPELGRSVEEAEALLTQTIGIFGENAHKRYVIRPINTLTHKKEYSCEMIMNALCKITKDEALSIKVAKSDDREILVTDLISSHIEIDQLPESIEKEVA